MSEMDRAWAKEVLIWWRDNATACLSPGYSFGPKDRAGLLKPREHQTRLVLKRVLRTQELPVLTKATPADKFVQLGAGIDLVAYALGVMETEDETRAKLGTAAPVMPADGLHPTIWGAASQLWSDGHFGQAVQRAATFLNAHVQDLLGRHDVSDAALMQQAFSPAAPEPGKPRLRWPGKDDDLTVKAMRGGILNFAQGCFMAIRNPATHGAEERPRQVWLEQLATLSTLARWIDGCEVQRAD
jgi:hypothetical protein